MMSKNLFELCIRVRRMNYILTHVLDCIRRRKLNLPVSLPPDEDSLVQAIYRVHYQVYSWIRSNEINIEHLDFSQYGWRWSEEEGAVVPVWFTGDQFPPEFSSRKSKLSEQQSDADDELDKTAKRKGRKRKSLPTAAERCLRNKSKFMQMVHEERRKEEYEESSLGRKEDIATEQIPEYEESIEDADDDEQIPEYDESIEDADDEEGETSVIEDGGEEDVEFFLKSDNSLLDNDDESEWEVSDFQSSEESDNDWEP